MERSPSPRRLNESKQEGYDCRDFGPAVFCSGFCLSRRLSRSSSLPCRIFVIILKTLELLDGLAYGSDHRRRKTPATRLMQSMTSTLVSEPDMSSGSAR